MSDEKVMVASKETIIGDDCRRKLKVLPWNFRCSVESRSFQSKLLQPVEEMIVGDDRSSVALELQKFGRTRSFQSKMLQPVEEMIVGDDRSSVALELEMSG